MTSPGLCQNKVLGLTVVDPHPKLGVQAAATHDCLPHRPLQTQGGPSGFHTRVFKVEKRQADGGEAVVCTYTSKDGEEVGRHCSFTRVNPRGWRAAQ